MKKFTKTRLVASIMALAMCVTMLVACGPTSNDTKPLVISTLQLDGVFSPFFVSSGYDTTVLDKTQIALIANDNAGAPVAGDEYPTYAKSFVQTYDASADQTSYEFVLKNGVKFSDGTLVTAKDVLFNFHVYADLKYDGSSTFYTTPIVGMENYRYQINNGEALPVYRAKAKKMASHPAPYTIVTGDDFTQAEYNEYWADINAETTGFAQDIVNYVDAGMINAAGLEDINAAIGGSFTLEQIKASKGLKVAAGMAMWGFGGVKNKVFTTSLGKTYTLTGEEANFPTVEEYWTNIVSLYTTNNIIDWDALLAESANGKSPETIATEAYVLGYTQSSKVENISGITVGEKIIKQEKHETIKIVIKGKDPKAIWNFGIHIAPMHYYAGTEVASAYTGQNAFTAGIYGKAMIDSLKTKNKLPMGAGPYKIDAANPTFFKDGVVYLEKNDSFLLGSPKIKFLRFKTVQSGQEFDSVKAGEVSYADPSASPSIINEISNAAAGSDAAKLNYVTVDNLGYGYIGINASKLLNTHERRALCYAMDRGLAITNFYPNGLGSVIERSMSKVSWAYPEGATAMYPYDATGAKAKEELGLAGYTVVDGKMMKGGAQATYTFTLPSEAKDHPAGSIFTQARSVLTAIGCKVDIVVDTGLLTKLNNETSTPMVFAAAWSATIDPDMFQVYSYRSQAGSINAFGIPSLYASGSTEDKALLTKLADNIDRARVTLDVAERTPLYHTALDDLMKLAIELPVYQRKNMYVFNKTLIKASSLTQQDKVTPYWSPIQEIWKVELI